MKFITNIEINLIFVSINKDAFVALYYDGIAESSPVVVAIAHGNEAYKMYKEGLARSIFIWESNETYHLMKRASAGANVSKEYYRLTAKAFAKMFYEKYNS